MERSKKNNTKPNTKPQKSKIKQKKKIPKDRIVLIPKRRLEPRLSLPSGEKEKKKQETAAKIENGKKLVVSLNTNEIEDNFKLCDAKGTFQVKFPSRDQNATKTSESSARNTSYMTKESYRESLKDIENYYGNEEDFQNFIKQTRQQNMSKGLYWTDRELRDLTYALQQHGFGDTAKLAAEVKTKTENDIRIYLKSRIIEMRKSKYPKCDPDKHRGRPKNPWTTPSYENVRNWPTIRKWRRLAYEQMLNYTRSKDYSRPVISALCQKFFEEEPEPADPQVINVKLIYKFIADCMNGTVPPQLPPKESALVLDLLREVRLMPLAYDFEEEREFLKNFKKATTFKPFQVKDEFKKKFKHASAVVDDPNTVSVPEEIFLELNRHRRLVQSFNPLMIPVWMVQKEQEHLEKYFEETKVYVD